MRISVQPHKCDRRWGRLTKGFAESAHEWIHNKDSLEGSQKDSLKDSQKNIHKKHVLVELHKGSPNRSFHNCFGDQSFLTQEMVKSEQK